jgi:hypothetical protein
VADGADVDVRLGPLESPLSHRSLRSFEIPSRVDLKPAGPAGGNGARSTVLDGSPLLAPNPANP